jgi:nicotinamide-nucleotide amidase
MRAEIVSVGTEILLGEIVDTNSAFIASRLPALGIDLYFKSVVGDNQGRIVDTLERALSRSDLIIMTGGLGPTEDDLTRESISDVLGEEPFVDPDLEKPLRAFFAGRGVAFPERNVKQAWLIPSASAILNPRGTAPGWWVEKNRSQDSRGAVAAGRSTVAAGLRDLSPPLGDTHYIVAMPGVPSEMTRMWEKEVAPRLRSIAGGDLIITRILKTAGIGESAIDEQLSPILKTTNPSLGIYAKQDGVHVRIAAKARTEAEARSLIEPAETEARRILGPIIWGADSDTLEDAVGGMLATRGKTLAVMESCTAGLLATTIADAEGASAYFLGGYITYATAMKMTHGVDPELIEQHGVISAEVAVDMARAARANLGADYGIGITGIAGDESVEGKPPGTIHIAVHDGERAEPMTYTFNQGRIANKRRAVTFALFLLRRTLLAADPGSS